MTQLASDLFDKPAQLSDGSEVPLKRAIDLWEGLHMLTIHPRERALLLELRDRAFDGSAFPTGEPRGWLTHAGYLDPTGAIAADARHVILSSLSGQLENIHLISPFTEYGDHLLAEFVVSASSVKLCFPPAEAESILKSVLGETWVRRIQPPRTGMQGTSLN